MKELRQLEAQLVQARMEASESLGAVDEAWKGVADARGDGRCRCCASPGSGLRVAPRAHPVVHPIEPSTCPGFAATLRKAC